MKYIAVTVLLCSVVSLANGFCMAKEDLKPGATHCVDLTDGTWHAVGSTWVNSACLRCTCSSCCATYDIPMGFDPECVKVFDQKACKYIVHRKDDPTTLCPVFSGVGK